MENLKAKTNTRAFDGDRCSEILHNLVSIYERKSLATQSTSNDNINSGFAFVAGDFNIDETENKITFLLNSGASDHLLNREDLNRSFTELQPPMNICIAKNGAYITATKKDKLNVISNMSINGVLENVYYFWAVPYNLLSVKKIQQSGMMVIFN